MAKRPTERRHVTTFRVRKPLLNAVDREAARRGITRSKLVELVLEGFIATPIEQRELPIFRKRPTSAGAEGMLE
jgi:hypothetical protein